MVEHFGKIQEKGVLAGRGVAGSSEGCPGDSAIFSPGQECLAGREERSEPFAGRKRARLAKSS
ncbi:hypothetical protein A2U01_0051633 [Trifolium medium]|uniref:Uncharacterized protein n=1 Tax=Trifolium medium TaxID=97028 RepID=A0A392R2V2_9FABA|nr:hypothetical protein [Trifolium medium]